jgi:hypothetical protein
MRVRRDHTSRSVDDQIAPTIQTDFKGRVYEWQKVKTARWLQEVLSRCLSVPSPLLMFKIEHEV